MTLEGGRCLTEDGKSLKIIKSVEGRSDVQRWGKKRMVEAVRGLMQNEKLDVLLTIGNECVGTNAYGCFRFLTAANVYYGLQSALFFPCSNPVGIVDSEISCGELKNAGIVTECRISTTPIQAIIDVLKESEITSGRLGTSLDILPQSWRVALEREMPGISTV